MIIIIIGCGGRENILSEKLNNGHNKLYCIGEWINPDIQNNVISYFKTSVSNINEILSCVKKINPDLIVVGPESILETSLIDQCTKLGFKCIGPNRNLAQLETSKIFTRNLLSEMNQDGLENNQGYDFGEIFEDSNQDGIYNSPPENYNEDLDLYTWTDNLSDLCGNCSEFLIPIRDSIRIPI